MKRPYTRRPASIRGQQLEDNYTVLQLAGIGKVSVAYNYAELCIDFVLSAALGLEPSLADAVVSRINGVDGKIELIRLAAATTPFDPNLTPQLFDTLGTFKELKKLRDLTIHSRILDAEAGIAQSSSRRAKAEEISISEEALNGLYDHLAAVQQELDSASQLFVLFWIHRRVPKDDPAKERIEADVQAHYAQFLQRQKRRKSLMPLPKFPEESEALEPPERETPPTR